MPTYNNQRCCYLDASVREIQRFRKRDFCLVLFSICSVMRNNCQGFQSGRLQFGRHYDCRIRPFSSVSSTCLFPPSSSLQQSEIDRISISCEDPRELERRIVALGRRGFTDEALHIYYSTSQPTVRLMNSAIDACARARPARLEKAFLILEEAGPTLQPNVFTFGALMSACARAKRGDKATTLLKSMQVCLYC